MMSDDFDRQMQAQNFAIAETIREDKLKLEQLSDMRKEQAEDTLDPIMKRKLMEYVELLNYAIKSIQEIISQSRR